MRPSSIVFGIGITLYTLLTVLIQLGISLPSIRIVAQQSTLIILAIFTYTAATIVTRRLDDQIEMLAAFLWEQAKRESKERAMLKKRKK